MTPRIRSLWLKPFSAQTFLGTRGLVFPAGGGGGRPRPRPRPRPVNYSKWCACVFYYPFWLDFELKFVVCVTLADLVTVGKLSNTIVLTFGPLCRVGFWLVPSPGLDLAEFLAGLSQLCTSPPLPWVPQFCMPGTLCSYHSLPTITAAK